MTKQEKEDLLYLIEDCDLLSEAEKIDFGKKVIEDRFTDEDAKKLDLILVQQFKKEEKELQNLDRQIIQGTKKLSALEQLADEAVEKYADLENKNIEQQEKKLKTDLDSALDKLEIAYKKDQDEAEAFYKSAQKQVDEKLISDLKNSLSTPPKK